ncbi:Hypothetical predicted protein, partial [Pelobates cultripes]
RSKDQDGDPRQRDREQDKRAPANEKETDREAVPDASHGSYYVPKLDYVGTKDPNSARSMHSLT